ncbi:MAG TPA: hypothetical protein DDY24_00885, partial [Alcaligenaceae bacterium]|nr:hypothetical protein [Alcaligenaceae bacterium]
MESIIQRFADYFCSVKFDDLPAEVVHKAKMLTIDLIGVALPGTRMDFPQIAIDYLSSLEGVRQSTIFGVREKVPALHAALVNGISSHA